MIYKILFTAFYVALSIVVAQSQSNQYYFIYSFNNPETPGMSISEYHEWQNGVHFCIVVDSSKIDKLNLVERDERGLVSKFQAAYSLKYLDTRLPFFKNHNENFIIRTIFSPDGFFTKPKTEVIAEELYDFQWELTGESKYIDSLLCYRAVTSFRCQEFEVWYTPEIPINAGPFILDGLPGLIVKARKTSAGDVSYILESFGKLDNPMLSETILEFDQSAYDDLPNYCDFKEVFDRYVSIIKAQAGDPDCTNCDMIIKNLSWSECWDDCE